MDLNHKLTSLFSQVAQMGFRAKSVYVLRAPSVDTMADTSVLSFEVDVLYTDVSDDVSCAGLASLVIDDDSITQDIDDSGELY